MTSKQGEKIVLDYLRKENRPFSAQDLVNNLGGQLGKTAIAKILDELASEKKINEKIYNKSKVYMTLQSVDGASFKADLRNLDEKVINLSGELSRVKADNARIENQLKGFESKVPIPELESKISDLDDELRELNSRVKNLKSANIKPISKEEKNKLMKEHEKYAKEWRKLKRITKEMMDTIMENCNMKKAQLIDDLGIILDEHENVEPPKI